MIQKRDTCKYCGCKMESITAKKQYCSDLHRVYYNRELKRNARNEVLDTTQERLVRTASLTVREHFASMAMMGILSNSYFMQYHSDIDIHKLSVRNADYLIAELNKP